MYNKLILIAFGFIGLTLLVIFLILNPSLIPFSPLSGNNTTYQNNGVPIRIGYMSISDNKESAYILAKLDKAEIENNLVYGEVSFPYESKDIRVKFLFHRKILSVITKKEDNDLFGINSKEFDFRNPQEAYSSLKKLVGKTIILSPTFRAEIEEDQVCNKKFISSIISRKPLPACIPHIYQLSYYDK